MTAKPLIFVHEDALGPHLPVFAAAPEDAPRLFVFDPARIAYQCYGLNRLVFFYEAASALCATMVKADTLTALAEALEKTRAEEIWAMATPDPWLNETLCDLNALAPVKLFDETPYVLLDKEPDLKRFSRYWRQAKDRAMEPTMPLTPRQRDLF